MKLIGYWIRSLCDDEFPPPQELVTTYDVSTRELIANYLDAGVTFLVYRGLSWCRFFCDRPMGDAELTDGKWVWPQDLSHYVRDHNVRLPDEFVEYVRSKPIDADTPDDNSSMIFPDESFWLLWCAEHRSNSLKSRIQSARSKADAEVEKIKADAITEREQAEGLSNSKCQSVGCHNRALARRALCASCILEPQWSWQTLAPYMNLRPVLEA